MIPSFHCASHYLWRNLSSLFYNPYTNHCFRKQVLRQIKFEIAVTDITLLCKRKCSNTPLDAFTFWSIHICATEASKTGLYNSMSLTLTFNHSVHKIYFQTIHFSQ